MLYSAVDCKESRRGRGIFASFGIACCDTLRLLWIATALLLTDYRQLRNGRAETRFTAAPPHMCLVLGNLAHDHFNRHQGNFIQPIGHKNNWKVILAQMRVMLEYQINHGVAPSTLPQAWVPAQLPARLPCEGLQANKALSKEKLH